MKNTKWFCILLGLLWGIAVVNAVGNVTIFAAAFSPDDKVIGVATNSGFQMRAQLTK